MIKAVVSGSFKFKPEIDRTIEALEETEIEVIEPTKGWLTIPALDVSELFRDGQIRPLPTEENLTTRQIEDRFLRALRRSNLIYLHNQEGYVGSSVALETGYALGLGIPIYALEPPNYELMEIDDWSLREALTGVIMVISPEKVAHHYRDNFSM